MTLCPTPPVEGVATIQPAGRVLGISTRADEGAVIDGIGLHGQQAILEVSSDLGTWTPIDASGQGADSISLTDPEAVEASVRFYRLRLDDE